MNELVVSRCSSDPALDKFDYLRKMKLKSFKELETTSKVRTKDLVLPLRIDRVLFGKMALPEQFRKKYRVNWGNGFAISDANTKIVP